MSTVKSRISQGLSARLMMGTCQQSWIWKRLRHQTEMSGMIFLAINGYRSCCVGSKVSRRNWVADQSFIHVGVLSLRSCQTRRLWASIFCGLHTTQPSQHLLFRVPGQNVFFSNSHSRVRQHVL